MYPVIHAQVQAGVHAINKASERVAVALVATPRRNLDAARPTYVVKPLKSLAAEEVVGI